MTTQQPATPETLADPSWYADSGASNHVTNNYENITNAAEYGGKDCVTVGNGDKLSITCVGKSVLTDGCHVLNLENVLCVPEIAKNLVSMSKLAQDNNVFIEFHGHFCLVKDKTSGRIMLRGVLKDGLYQLQDANARSASSLLSSGLNKSRSSTAYVVSNVEPLVNVAVSKSVWHRRLGHPSARVLDFLIKECKLQVKSNEMFKFCESCQFGKAHALPFPLSNYRATKRFDLIHTDLWGPAPIPSVEGYRYYALFLDDHSRYLWLYPLKQKSDIVHAFNHLLSVIKTQFGCTIKSVQSDNGGEYTPIHNICSQLGITTRLSCPYTSAQNGRAERKHRHVVEIGLTILAQASMPLCHWWDAFVTATQLINGLPTEVLRGKSPMELMW